MRLPRLYRCRTVARDCGKPLRDTLLGSSKGRDYRIESRSRQRFTAILHYGRRNSIRSILRRTRAVMPAARAKSLRGQREASEP